LPSEEYENILGKELGQDLKKYEPFTWNAVKNDNCLIVPHIGGMTYESREATDIFIANKIIKSLT